MERIDIAEKFGRFTEHWRPKIVAALNGQEIKLVKIQGAFPWHRHEDADEMFLVWRGRIRLEFHDHAAALGPGELIVVPRGTIHRPVADAPAEIILFEPAGVRNTGQIVDERYTAPDDARIQRALAATSSHDESDALHPCNGSSSTHAVLRSLPARVPARARTAAAAHRSALA